MAGTSLHQAQAIIDDALGKAEQIGVAMNVAVVDAGNNLAVFPYQDGAWLGSIDVAHRKADTARGYDSPTQDLYPETQLGGSLYGIVAGDHGQLSTFAGGIPIPDGDEIVGAIGVSGGTVDQDQLVAEAGVGAYRSAAAA